jgi:predicted deacylase
MSNTLIKSSHKEIISKRNLGSIKGSKISPSIIIFGGIHGNEPAGIHSLRIVLQKIEDENIKLNGNLYAIAGNLNALRKNIRFETTDLNRIWTDENIANINKPNKSLNSEEKEQLELYQIVKEILSNDKGPFYFIDLHTTSADTIPFITISDSLNNRKFSGNFSMPIVLGIEEYLDGPLLTYINEFGHISLGFEAGQHNEPISIENSEAFIWLSLEASGCINKKEIKKLEHYHQILTANGQNKDFFEIDYRYLLQNKEDFIMVNGFKNFDSIKKQQVLALSNDREIKANMNGRIFMPLYQQQGNDGFFIITKISIFWLQLSKIVRKLHLYHLLRLLPGIKQDPIDKYTLIVNPKTAKFLATEIFHLFGYRKKVIRDNKLHFIKRDRKIIEFNH